MKVIIKDEEVSFNLFEIVKNPKNKTMCFQMDTTNEAQEWYEQVKMDYIKKYLHKNMAKEFGVFLPLYLNQNINTCKSFDPS